MTEERASNNSRYGEELMEIDNMSVEALVTDHDRQADELDALERFLNNQYERMFEAGSFSGGATLFRGIRPGSDNSMSLAAPGDVNRKEFRMNLARTLVSNRTCFMIHRPEPSTQQFCPTPP